MPVDHWFAVNPRKTTEWTLFVRHTGRRNSRTKAWLSIPIVVIIAQNPSIWKFQRNRSIMLLNSLGKSLASIIAITCGLTALPTMATATDFTAGVVMEKMPSGERYAFVTGIIEGLAYARFQSDGKQVAGMNCIYKWFYDAPASGMDLITAAFKQYPTYPPGTVVGVILERKCPRT